MSFSYSFLNFKMWKMNCNFWNKSNSWNQLCKKITQDLVIDFVFLAQKIINHFANEAILFCKTRNIRRKFTQPFYNNKIRRFHFIFWPTDFSFQNSYNKVGITRHKYTLHLCQIHKTHIFSSSKRGLFFFSLLSSQKSNKSKNRPFFLRSSGLSC